MGDVIYHVKYPERIVYHALVRPAGRSPYGGLQHPQAGALLKKDIIYTDMIYHVGITMKTNVKKKVLKETEYICEHCGHVFDKEDGLDRCIEHEKACVKNKKARETMIGRIGKCYARVHCAHGRIEMYLVKLMPSREGDGDGLELNYDGTYRLDLLETSFIYNTYMGTVLSLEQKMDVCWRMPEKGAWREISPERREQHLSKMQELIGSILPDRYCDKDVLDKVIALAKDMNGGRRLDLWLD